MALGVRGRRSPFIFQLPRLPTILLSDSLPSLKSATASCCITWTPTLPPSSLALSNSEVSLALPYKLGYFPILRTDLELLSGVSQIVLRFTYS